MMGVIVSIHALPYEDATDIFKGRKRKYELGTEWSTASV